MGLLCAERNVGNLTNCSVRNYGIPVLRTTQKNVTFVLALITAHVLALNAAHVLRLNKADALALNTGNLWKKS